LIKDGRKAFFRDILQLTDLHAIRIEVSETLPNVEDIDVSINLDWSQQIDESEFLQKMKAMPKGKTFKFLS
jgi:hypothetical protein